MHDLAPNLANPCKKPHHLLTLQRPAGSGTAAEISKHCRTLQAAAQSPPNPANPGSRLTWHTATQSRAKTACHQNAVGAYKWVFCMHRHRSTKHDPCHHGSGQRRARGPTADPERLQVDRGGDCLLQILLFNGISAPRSNDKSTVGGASSISLRTECTSNLYQPRVIETRRMTNLLVDYMHDVMVLYRTKTAAAHP